MSEPRIVQGYCGLGCPKCGQDVPTAADDHVAVEGGEGAYTTATQGVSCTKCGITWTNTFIFDSVCIGENTSMYAGKPYFGVGCPRCGPGADTENDSVEIDEVNGATTAKLDMTCCECDHTWITTYRFHLAQEEDFARREEGVDNHPTRREFEGTVQEQPEARPLRTIGCYSDSRPQDNEVARIGWAVLFGWSFREVEVPRDRDYGSISAQAPGSSSWQTGSASGENWLTEALDAAGVPEYRHDASETDR